MKNNKIVLTVSLAIAMLFIFPNKVTAQRKKRIARHHVKKHHRKHIKARRRAHYRYRHLPRRGKVIRKVGVGFLGIRFRGVGYQYYKGIWYKPLGKHFVVAAAPFGIRLHVLPVGYRRFTIQNRPYFYYYGTYYVKIDSTDEYEVVQAPVGAEVDALPEGYKVLTINGADYYKLDQVYYRPRLNNDGKEYFVVVKNPAL